MTTKPMHQYEIEIAAPPEAVWRALTDGNLTRRYFFETVVASDWTPGSAVAYDDGEGDRVVEGNVIVFAPYRRLSFTWHALWSPDVAAELPSRVTWELSPTPAGTRLVLVHDQFDGETALYRDVVGGWPGILERMKAVLEEDALVRSGRA